MGKTLTVQTLRVAASNQITNPKHFAERYKVGDLIGTHSTEQNATFDGSVWLWNEETTERFNLVHITEIPDAIDMGNLLLPMQVANGSPVLVEVEENPWIRQRLRKFCLDTSALPDENRNALLSSRQTTLTYATFKTAVYKKIVTDSLSPSTDTLELLADEDL